VARILTVVIEHDGEKYKLDWQGNWFKGKVIMVGIGDSELIWEPVSEEDVPEPAYLKGLEAY